MNTNNYKKLAAQEWLIFLVAILIGVVFSTLTYFVDSYETIAYKQDLYESLKTTKWIDAIPSKTELQKFRKEYPQYNDLSDVTLAIRLAKKFSAPFISYTEFSNILNDNSRRKIFYDSVSAKEYLGDYNTFENKVANPTFYSGLSKLFKHLFSRLYWLNTFFSLLIPYLIIQLIRSVYYSVVTLYRKGKNTNQFGKV